MEAERINESGILHGSKHKCYSKYSGKRIQGPDKQPYAVVEVWNGANGVFVGGFYGGGSVMAAAMTVDRLNDCGT